MWQLLLAAVVAATTPAPQRGAAPGVDDLVGRLQARYDATSDFTAAVSQEMVMTSYGRTFTASGSVYFKRPGRMRWELTDRQEQTIVADGTTLWVYQPSEQQVFRASLKQAFNSTTPVSFLIGIGRITDDFAVAIEGETEGLTYLRLIPKSGSGFGTLRLGVDCSTYDIKAAEIHDPLGNITRLRFSDIKRDVGLKDELFRFTVPPGAEVLDAPPTME